MEIRRPNDEGSTMCIVRYLVDTPAGWIGAYDRAALERIAEVEGLLLEVAEGYEWLRDNGYSTPLRERIRAALKGGEA